MPPGAGNHKWRSPVPAVPAGEYHQLILITLGVLAFFFLGSLVFFAAMLCGVVGALLVSLVTGK